ncbi:antibiotic biosynthesis monooxygenase family protein [Microbulbifer sp. JMSA004]|uniref:antibiotic biosynthesis monooxygenase family protein n=1 Tax=unclassified Microbulbifer TaxID=2619833 RepID=UPI0024AD70BE|nr:antibiotic biosynthesis monooxygenase [Microbulbifer sp. VAAF005]WHI45162.1 antibiotic biosynthesis monooxygenase [Microbulbifer sp. VAAF005]
MIAVIFEVTPKPSGKDKYLAVAADLKEHLTNFDGFISVERFQSLNQPRKILSLSIWRDEESVVNWKNHKAHCDAQHLGKKQLFDNYRIRIGEILRDYSMQ